MYLSAIKLSGFKSFVEPTTVFFHERLIGIVGPNGCGKSNIVDAIRWVLGESKASSLRGESLSDVIFNGSDQRKAVDRVSVELIFDNSEGRISGQWGQFAEISVRRTLDRQGEAVYQINRQNVRKKDITALFLGTGVGARGYSIIEQGTISRLIEAKPEEVRLIIEETAGVSKYRERRKETEHRLSDSKNHLTRLADVTQELDAQIEKLSSQAEVAKQYRNLLDEKQQKTAQLAYIQLTAAKIKGEKLADSLINKAVELEAANARKTAIIADIEKERVVHQDVNGKLDLAQAEFYRVNGEVIRIETTIKHHHLAVDKIKQQLSNLTEQKQKAEHEIAERQAQIETLIEEIEASETSIGFLVDQKDVLFHGVTSAEDNLNDVRRKRDEVRDAQAQCQQALALEATHHRHATQQLDDLLLRLENLTQQQEALSEPITDSIDTLEAALADSRAQIEAITEHIQTLQEEKQNLKETQQGLDEKLGQIYRDIAHIDAQIHSLTAEEQRADDEKLNEWFEKQEMAGQHPLWEAITVTDGWEMAVESILRERLGAKTLFDLTVSQAFFTDRPPARHTFYARNTEEGHKPSADSLAYPLLSDKVSTAKPEQKIIIDEWLSKVYLADDEKTALSQRQQLPYGGCFVTSQGDIIDRNSVTWFSEKNSSDSVLSLRKKLQTLKAEQESVQKLQKQYAEEKAEVDQALLQTEQSFEQANIQLKQTEKQVYDNQIALVSAKEKQEQIKQQKARIEKERAEIDAGIQKAETLQETAQAAMEVHESRLMEIEEKLENWQLEYESIESDLASIRQDCADIDQKIHEQKIHRAASDAKLTEARATIDRLTISLQRIDDDIEMTQDELLSCDESHIAESLNMALAERNQAEEALTLARNAVDDAVVRLQNLENQKAEAENAIVPIHESISELRLSVQAQSLKAAQYQEQLDQMGIDPDTIDADKKTGENTLQRRLIQIEEEVESLGAVNLAALEELDAANARRHFLTEQMADITEAIDTLEGAIGKIDKEARSLLSKTFEIVNQNFGKLFPVLFGGGQAKLSIEGDDLLSAGVRIWAQPPGKKNSTISLLSGGEKALTAVALVFALFRLNPAPFCLLDEIDAPLDDPNTVRLCDMIQSMADKTQFLFITHNKITMELAERLVGVTMPESGVSRIVDVNVADALKINATTAG